MKKKFVCILLALVLVLGCVSAVSAASHPFTDVKAGAWYEDEVAYCYSNSLMNGTGSSKFEPELEMDRAMLVTVLYRIEGEPSVSVSNPFTDVASSKYYSNAVMWAYSTGVTEGTSSTKFSPDAKITREMMVTMFYRYAVHNGYNVSASADLSKYTDSVKVNSWAKSGMQWAVATGIITGISNTTLDPSGTATRAQCATIIQRFVEWEKANAHTHSYTATVTKEATCTEAGVKTFTCTCGDSYTEAITKLNHSYTSRVTKEATCTEAGVRTYACSKCGNTYTEAIAKLNHSYTSKVTKEATCTADGVKTYTCSKCGNTYTEAIAKIAHSYTSKVTKEATCTADGAKTYTCSKCGNTYTEAIAKIAHSYTSKVTKEATCTADGAKTYTCSKCGNTYTEAIAKLSHSYTSKVTKEATCTADGVKTYTCSKCGNTYTEAIAKIAHSYTSKVTKEATCTADGVKTYTCSKCGDTYTESIAKIAHSYTSKVTKKATCAEEGVKTYTCSKCGGSYTEAIPATGHSHTAEVTKKATCTEEGVKTYTCSKCGGSYTESIPMIDHNYVASTWEASCTKPAATVYTCSMCGDSYAVETGSALGHDWSYHHEDEVTERVDILCICTCGWSCTDSAAKTADLTNYGIYWGVIHQEYYRALHLQAGNSHSYSTKGIYEVVTPAVDEWSCTRCDAFTTNHDEVTGHTVRPTKTATGSSCKRSNYSTYKCKDCGYTYDDNYIESTGHNFSVWERSEEYPGLAIRSCQNKNCAYYMYDSVEAVQLGTMKAADGSCYHVYKPEMGTVCILCGVDSVPDAG